MRPGKRNLITDVAGLRVGNAEDRGVKTGVSVLTAESPFTAAVHVMGGAPGTRETELLAPDRLVQQVDALVLSGGSTFGLDAASGVVAGLRASSRGFEVGPVKVPIVPGAIIFDLLNGGEKDWPDTLYADLGRAALANAGQDFRIGTHGAGTGATSGDLKGGLGSASLVTDSGLTVGALVANNSVGNATDSAGRFFASPFEMNGEFGNCGAPANFDPGQEPGARNPGENTVIAIVATDAALTQAEATRMAIAAHDGIARAVVPSHTLYDGDLVFGVSTGDKPLKDPATDHLVLGHAAAVALSRAVARAVYHAKPAANDTLPCWSDAFG